MTTVYKYRVWCSTDSKFEYTAYLESEPTTCPTNTAHTIDTTKTVVVDSIERQTITIKEEITPTNGKYQATTIAFDCDPSGVTTYTHSFDFPINALSSFIVTDSNQKGDNLTVYVAPNTTVGALAANASAGVSTFTVSQTVIDYTHTGLLFHLTDGVNVDNLGRIKSINTDTNQITTTYSTTNSYSAASPTYCQITAIYSDNIEFGPSWRYEFGETKIGAAYVPTGTEVQFVYTNKTNEQKRLAVTFEYLY